MALLPKVHTADQEIADQEMDEITVHKIVADDQESPDFPMQLRVRSIQELTRELQDFLGDTSSDISGIVVQGRIISQKKFLPREATVQFITKKGRKYIEIKPVLDV